MILAAGLGTRLAPFTDKHPKALAQIGSMSLLEYNVRYLQKSGIYDIIVNVHHFADQVEAAVQHSNGWGSRITISDERETVLETGGGLKHAATYFKGENDFLVLNVDVLTDLKLPDLIRFHQAKKAMASLAVMKRSTSRYLLFDGNMQLQGWKQTVTGELKGQEGDPFAFSGIQVISSELLHSIQRKGKFSLIDVYLDAMKSMTIMGFDHSGDRFLDVGKPESLKLAESLFQENK